MGHRVGRLKIEVDVVGPHAVAKDDGLLIFSRRRRTVVDRQTPPIGAADPEEQRPLAPQAIVESHRPAPKQEGSADRRGKCN